MNYSQLLSHTRDYVTHYQLMRNFRFYRGSKAVRQKRTIYINGHGKHRKIMKFLVLMVAMLVLEVKLGLI